MEVSLLSSVSMDPPITPRRMKRFLQLRDRKSVTVGDDPGMNRVTWMLTTGLILTAASGTWFFVEKERLQTALGEALAIQHSVSPPRRATASAIVEGSPGKAGGSGMKPPQPGNRPAVRSSTEGVAGQIRVVENGDGTLTIEHESGAWKQLMTAEEWRHLQQLGNAALIAVETRLPRGPSWSPGNAAGPPDTPNHGDYSTAWASQQPDGGKEWMQLKYKKATEVREISIHESYNPGALSKVSAILPDGTERVIWEGTEAVEEGLVERVLAVPPGIRSDQIRIELDTSRVPGWNEIDAVEIVGADGSRQWASESTASSYFGGSGGSGVENATLLFMDGYSGKINDPTTRLR